MILKGPHNREFVMNHKAKALKGAIVSLFAFSVMIPSAMAAWPAHGIQNTPHDFSQASDATWNGTGQICLPCHTPHGGNKGVQNDAPLWNHTITTATYTVYTSATMKATIGQPTGLTKLCLSCHDGTLSKGAFGHNLNDTSTLGTPRLDRRSSHPVSFVYDSALAQADKGVFDPATTSSGLPEGGTIATDMLQQGGTNVSGSTPYNTSDPNANGSTQNMLQCTSCHEPHNKYGNDYFLRIDNSGSKLCLTCHNK